MLMGLAEHVQKLRIAVVGLLLPYFFEGIGWDIFIVQERLDFGHALLGRIAFDEVFEEVKFVFVVVHHDDVLVHGVVHRGDVAGGLWSYECDVLKAAHRVVVRVAKEAVAAKLECVGAGGKQLPKGVQGVYKWLFSCHRVAMLLSIRTFFGDYTGKERKGGEGIEADVGVAIVLTAVVRGFE